MPNRVVKSDAAGPYVLMNRRKYRCDNPQTSKLRRGDTVLVWEGTTWQRKKTPHTADFYKYGAGYEKWTTKDPYIAPKSKATSAKAVKPGEHQIEIRRNVLGAQILAIVGENKVKHSGRVWRNPLYLGLNAAANLTWDEWDDLVKAINEARDDVPVAGIVAKLKEEVALDDELQAYITEKGLA